jgi:5-methylcytosine-specific restriction endonuclease McrA
LPYKDPEKRKAYDRAYRRVRTEKKRAYDRAYYEGHREERLAYARAYREQHPGLYAEKSRAYYEGHREEHRARSRAYEATPHGRAVVRASAARYRASPRGRAVKRAACSLRRAQRLGAEYDGHSLTQLDARFLPFCTFCFQPLTLESAHRDHWRPLAAGGPHTLANLSHMHPECNLKKSAHVLDARSPNGWT